MPVPYLSECSGRKFQYDSANERCTNDGEEINGIYDLEECCDKFFLSFGDECQYLDLCKIVLNDTQDSIWSYSPTSVQTPVPTQPEERT